MISNSASFVVGIDASRNRSGGAKAHLIGILAACDPNKYGCEYVHVWAYRSLLDELPDYPWLIKHNPSQLEGTLFSQLIWQATSLADELKKVGCDILFTTDASTLCRFKPMVVLSQDMLSYEPGVMKCFGYSFARLRLLIILYLQNNAFRFADGVIFLTKYAGNVIQKSCGLLASTAYIPHGVGDSFKLTSEFASWPESHDQPIRCVYVSNAEMYKHQWVVVEAFSHLRSRGINVKLYLIGGGCGSAQQLLENAISIYDPQSNYIEQTAFLPHSSLPELLSQAHLFVFASSCENMPVTLVEGMAVGLPIACSNRGPMPDILEDGGVYFNPEDAESISEAIEKIIHSPVLRTAIAHRAKELSVQYNWKRCADETFAFITETYLRTKLC